jgi:hypothetical protein
VPVEEKEGNFVMGEVLEEVCNRCRAMCHNATSRLLCRVLRRPRACR